MSLRRPNPRADYVSRGSNHNVARSLQKTGTNPKRVRSAIQLLHETLASDDIPSLMSGHLTECDIDRVAERRVSRVQYAGTKSYSCPPTNPCEVSRVCLSGGVVEEGESLTANVGEVVDGAIWSDFGGR